MKPIHVLYDGQVFAQQIYGGVSRIFYELITRLSANPETRISLFHGLYINRYPLEEIKDKCAFYYGKEVLAFPHISVLLKPLNNFLFRRHIAGKAVDIYHPTNYSSLVSRWKKSPVVLTVNDMIPELFPHTYTDIRRRLKIKKECIRRADMIIVISRQTGEDLLNFYNVSRDKVRVIYPGAPVPPRKGEKIRRFPHPRPYILYVGTRKQGYKNFYGFFSGFTASSKLVNRFDIICFGGGYLKRKELRYLSGCGCGLEMHLFQPPGDEELLPMLYRGAAALVYPSLYEGFGLPPLEAMTYGCPVIAGHVSAIPEVLGDAAAYFDPYRLETLTAVMETVLFNPVLKKYLSQKGREQVKLYSWEKMATETLRLYREITGN